MDKASENIPVRLPDPASIEAVLARLPAGADEAALAAALTEAFPGFPFSTADTDDQYWRDTRSVIAADGTRIAEYRPWMEVRRRDLRLLGYDTRRELLGGYLKREEGDNAARHLRRRTTAFPRCLVGSRHAERDIRSERRLAHARPPGKMMRSEG